MQMCILNRDPNNRAFKITHSFSKRDGNIARPIDVELAVLDNEALKSTPNPKSHRQHSKNADSDDDFCHG